MSRSSAPSSMQVEKLLQYIEEKRFLATGHARTAHARDKTRAAWEDVALKLNSDASGCIKSWQQWAKYWKDKKAAIKKKVSLIRMARLRTGGGVGEPIILSSLEEKVVSLMGGESFAVGDSQLEINPFHSSNQAPIMDVPVSAVVDPPEINESVVMSLQEECTDQGSESILQQPLSHPSTSREGNIQYYDIPQMEIISPQPAVPHGSRTASLSPRRRRPLTARRRIFTPPSQRRSQMASLTERFIAIEEKRLEHERLLMDNQEKMFTIFMEVTRALSRQTQALQELCSATKALAEKNNKNE